MPAGKIYSFKMMRDQVLTAIRQTADATGIINVNAWLNEQYLIYAAKWPFPELITKWRTIITAGEQFDLTLPFIIREVPRDMVTILEAKILDENVSPIEWHPVQIRPMNEFERKFYNSDLKEDPDIPRDIALFIKESSVFFGSGGPFSFTETFESLTPATDLNGQGGWNQTVAAHVIGTVTTTNPLRGAQAVAFGELNDFLGFPYRHDVVSTERSITRFRVRRPGTTASALGNTYILGASDGQDPTLNDLVGLAATNYSWRLVVVLGQTGTGTTLLRLRAPNNAVEALFSTTDTRVDNLVEIEVGNDALVTVRWNGLAVLTQTTADPTVRRVHMTALKFDPGDDDAVIDDVVLVDSSVERLNSNGIQMRSTDNTEETDLRAGATIYTTEKRTREEKFEAPAAPGTTAQVLFAPEVFGVVGLGKSDSSKGIIIFESNDAVPVLIGEIMPWETSATFMTLQMNPFPDLTYELHLTYRRSPPIMVNDSDTTFLLPALIQGAIIESAIVRGLKYNEDFQAAAAAAAIQQQKEAEFVQEYFPELIEESHTYIGL